MARNPGGKAGTETEPKLSEEHQIYVVSCLANFKTLDWIVKDLNERFGLTVTKQAVWYYSPANASCPDRWKELFDAVRIEREKNMGRIASANLWRRVEMLDEDIQTLRAKGNLIGAAALSRQIAEDIGGSYTKTREFTGANGAPLVPAAVPLTAEALLTLAASMPRPEPTAKPDAPVVPEPER